MFFNVLVNFPGFSFEKKNPFNIITNIFLNFCPFEKKQTPFERPVLYVIFIGVRCFRLTRPARRNTADFVKGITLIYIFTKALNAVAVFFTADSILPIGRNIFIQTNCYNTRSLSLVNRCSMRFSLRLQQY